MEIFIFVLGTLLVLIMGVTVAYRIIDMKFEKFFWGSFFLVLLMSIMTVLLKFWGHYFFSHTLQKVILLIISILILLFIIFYISIYFRDNEFEFKLLLFGVPILIEVWIILSSIFEIDSIFSNSYLEYNNGFLVITAIIIGILLYSIVYSLNQFLKKERLLHIYRRNSNVSLTTAEALYMNNASIIGKIKIDQAVINIYTLLKEDKLSPSKAFECLRCAKFPSSLSRKIIERIFDTGLYCKVSSISLIEFAQEILPEVFHSEKYVKTNYRSSSMDIRIFEDLYYKFSNYINSERKESIEINEKLDKLLNITTSRDSDKQLSKKNEIIYDVSSCQNQIRELFHALEGPLATTEMAVSNLQVSLKNIDGKQKSKLLKIKNNISLITSILYAYRELSFMTFENSEHSVLKLPLIIENIKDFIGCDAQIEFEISWFPDFIPYYSTNLITIILLPLLQNAIEATPKNKKINVNYSDTADYYLVSIKNFCTKAINKEIFNKEGYSSKGNKHIGTGISIVKRISSVLGINFCIMAENNQVIATLKFPKKKKGGEDNDVT